MTADKVSVFKGFRLLLYQHTPNASFARQDKTHSQGKISNSDAAFVSDYNFSDFWSAYPRKVAKASALKAWCKLKPDKTLVADILSALALQCSSEQWQCESGRYIPYPATWINARRWEDERPLPDTDNAQKRMPQYEIVSIDGKEVAKKID